MLLGVERTACDLKLFLLLHCRRQKSHLLVYGKGLPAHLANVVRRYESTKLINEQVCRLLNRLEHFVADFRVLLDCLFDTTLLLLLVIEKVSHFTDLCLIIFDKDTANILV